MFDFRRSLFSLVPLALLAQSIDANTQCTPHGSLAFRSPVTVAHGLRASVISANLTTPRGIALDALENVLVIERGLGVTAFTEHDPSCNGWLRTIVVQNANLTQGIQVYQDALYVSTPGEVLKYTYDVHTRSVTGGPVTLITGIPPDGGTFHILHNRARKEKRRS
jgi:glucose/arabinose dehydrogenase